MEGRPRKREKEKEGERERKRQTDRQTDRDRDRDRETETERKTETERERQRARDRQTERERKREIVFKAEQAIPSPFPSRPSHLKRILLEIDSPTHPAGKKKTDYHQSPHRSHKRVTVGVVIAQLVAHPFTTLNTTGPVRIITQQPKLTHLRGTRSVRRRVTT